MSQLSMKERFELFAKFGAFGDLNDMMLQESNLSFLLVEQLEADDVVKLRNSIANSMKVAKNAQSNLGDKFPGSLGPYLEDHINNLQKAEQLAAKIDLGNPEGLKGFLGSMFGDKIDVGRALQGVLEIESKANQSLTTFKNAVAIIHRNLKGKLEDDTVLSNIPSDVGITTDQLKSAVSKAFGSAGKKGIFAKMAGFFKKKAAKIPGVEEIKDFPADDFADELLGLTFKDLTDLNAAAGKLNPPEPNEESITDVNDAAEKAEKAGDPDAALPGEPEAAAPEGETGEEPEEEAETTKLTKDSLIQKAKDAGGDAGEAIFKKLIDSGALKDAGLEIAEESFHKRNLLDLLFEQIVIPHKVYQAAVTAVSEEDEEIFNDVDLDDLRDKLSDIADPDIEIEAKKISPLDLDGKEYRQGRFVVTLNGNELVSNKPSTIVAFLAMELAKDEDLQKDFEEDAEIEVAGGGGEKIPFMEMEDMVDRINKDLEAGKYGESSFRLGQEAEPEEESEGEPEGEPEEAPEEGSLSSQLFGQIDPEDLSKGYEIIDSNQAVALRNLGLSDAAGSISSLVDKPNSANRKAFIKNLNQLVGKDMFEAVQEKQVTDESSEIMNRWRKLAGLNNEN